MIRRAVRAACVILGIAAATVALVCALLLADDSERWLRASLWLVVVAGVGAVAGPEFERGRVR